MQPETLVDWARRQGGSSVSATGPRNVLNRKNLQTASSRSIRDMALKELYIELESLIYDPRAAKKAAVVAAPPAPAPRSRFDNMTSMMPSLGGRLFFPSTGAAPAAARPASVLPEGVVERRRPRPA